MANPRIEVEIGAVIDGLKKGFGESVGIIGALEKQALELDKALRNATTVPEIAKLNALTHQANKYPDLLAWMKKHSKIYIVGDDRCSHVESKIRLSRDALIAACDAGPVGEIEL